MINYPTHSYQELGEFLENYIADVLKVARQLNIDLKDPRFACDHLGMQVLSADEFDQAHQLLLEFSQMVHNAVIHERRNRFYRFNQPFVIEGISIPKIEIFEPKPEADLAKLRPGIEHIAFLVEDYNSFSTDCKKNNLPIDKEVDLNGSKFFKTKLIDNIEIEFRNDKLVQ